MIGFAVALVAGNAFEWWAHKYVLHGTPDGRGGRKSPRPKSRDTHWSHHRLVRSEAFYDRLYESPLKHGRTRDEIGALAVLTGLSALAAPVAPFFALGSAYVAGHYWYVHRKTHVDVAWGKANAPWHYDHHMRADQNANWCVTRPWFDYVMGTRAPTSRETLESNPLGMRLPAFVERRVNDIARRLFPRTYARIDEAVSGANAPSDRAAVEQGAIA